MVSQSANKSRLMRTIFLSLFLFAITFTSESQADGLHADYKPPFLPITISVDEDGISVSGDTSIATPWGTFSVGYSHDFLKKEHDNLVLVIRDKEREHIYEIKNNNKLFVFVNGVALIEAENNVVIVDVTKSKRARIQFSTDKEKADNVKKQIVPIEFNVLTRESTGHRFNVLHDGDKITAGSRMKLNFKVDKLAYVYIYHVKSTGLSQRLFPSSEVGSSSRVISNPIAGGKTVYLPAKEESYVIESESSNDDIYFIALSKKDERLESAGSNAIEYISSNYGLDFNAINFSNR